MKNVKLLTSILTYNSCEKAIVELPEIAFLYSTFHWVVDVTEVLQHYPSFRGPNVERERGEG